MKKLLKITSLSIALTFITSVSQASGPWVYFEGQGAVGTALVYEEFDRAFVRGNSATDTSAVVNVHQENVWFWGQYGLTDQLTLGAQIGYTQSAHQASDFEYQGWADSRLTAQYQFLNEWENAPLTMSVKTALIGRGTYERAGGGRPHSPGDLGNGAELGVQVGKFVKSNLSLWAEAGQRWMSQGVPDEAFYGLGASLYANEFTVNFAWKSKESDEGPDIGDPATGFSPTRFFEVKEERTWAEWGLGYTPVESLSLNLTHAYVLTGKNTADSQIYSLAVGYSF